MADVTIEVPAELAGFVQGGIELHREGALDDLDHTQSAEDRVEFDAWELLAQQTRRLRPDGCLRLDGEPWRLQQVIHRAMVDLSMELHLSVGNFRDFEPTSTERLLSAFKWLLATNNDLGADVVQALVHEAESATHGAAD